MRRMFGTFKSIDSSFDSLNIDASEPSEPRARRVPHCDCRKAVETFFNESLATSHRASDVDETYTMVPVSVDAEGTCSHCGYTTCFQPLGNYVQAIANRNSSRKAVADSPLGFTKKVKPVVGVNLTTGEELTYPSAAHAYRAGHGNVQQAMEKKGGVLRGLQWRRV